MPLITEKKAEQHCVCHHVWSVYTVNSIAVQKVTIDPPVINCHNISTPSLHPAASLVHAEPLHSFLSCLLGVWAHLSSMFPSILPSLSPSPPWWHSVSPHGACFLSSYSSDSFSHSSAPTSAEAHHVFNNLEKGGETLLLFFFYCSDKSIPWPFAVCSKKENKLVQWADIYNNHSWDD